MVFLFLAARVQLGRHQLEAYWVRGQSGGSSPHCSQLHEHPGSHWRGKQVSQGEELMMTPYCWPISCNPCSIILVPCSIPLHLHLFVHHCTAKHNFPGSKPAWVSGWKTPFKLGRVPDDCDSHLAVSLVFRGLTTRCWRSCTITTRATRSIWNPKVNRTAPSGCRILQAPSSTTAGVGSYLLVVLRQLTYTTDFHVTCDKYSWLIKYFLAVSPVLLPDCFLSYSIFMPPGFLEKNRDTFNADLMRFVNTSKSKFLRSLFAADVTTVRHFAIIRLVEFKGEKEWSGITC